MPRYVALLRGINVGGSNIIRMTDLAASCTSLGLAAVRTYIASGNILFESPVRNIETLAKKMEAGFSKQFSYDARVVVVGEDTLRRVVEKAPRGFGKKPAEYRYDVIFFRAPGSAEDAIGEIPAREGVDRLWAANGVVYFDRLIARAAQSKLDRVTRIPAYKFMTIRNWNTTTKLLGMMDAA
jgi:uncharacterized protein (DUF1697 family)